MKYRHYKGGMYIVLEERAYHSESGETLVIYKSLDNGKVWARPYENFFDLVGNTFQQRFEKVEE